MICGTCNWSWTTYDVSYLKLENVFERFRNGLDPEPVFEKNDGTKDESKWWVNDDGSHRANPDVR
jgi:hypothetical protein